MQNQFSNLKMEETHTQHVMLGTVPYQSHVGIESILPRIILPDLLTCHGAEVGVVLMCLPLNYMCLPMKSLVTNVFYNA